ncbi:hypothetical protein RQP46_006803 [Phenoliferia psychrophenolica]
MLGISYDSDDSDSEDTPQQPTPAAAPVAAPAPAAKASFLSLPPPKSSLSLPAPSSSSSSTPAPPIPSKALPKKGKGGPVKILLDLPPTSSSASSSAEPSNAEADGPPRKKPKFSLGSGAGGGGGMSGLASMLPAPKNESVAVKLERALGGQGSASSAPLASAAAGAAASGGAEASADEGRTFSTGFVPHRVGKGKKPAPSKPGAAPPVVVEAPTTDFFGLGTVTSSSHASTSSLSSSKPLSISSAPIIAETPPPPSASTYGDEPTPDDPYPGFTQLPSGQWVAKDQATYDLWVAAAAQDPTAAEKGFGEAEIARTGIVDVDAARSREAWEKRPQALARPGSEALDKPVVKAPVKLGGKGARAKGQLSALLSEAVENRAELEERIAQSRNNRKSAGNKYGF